MRSPSFHLPQVVSEIELRKIAVKMLLAQVMKRADDAEFEQSEETFNRVRVLADIFTLAVINGLMAGVLAIIREYRVRFVLR